MVTARREIEFIGGPRDGGRSVLLRKTPLTPLRYPLEIRVTVYDIAAETDIEVGRYVRDGTDEASESMRYVWSNTAADAHTGEQQLD